MRKIATVVYMRRFELKNNELKNNELKKMFGLTQKLAIIILLLEKG